MGHLRVIATDRAAAPSASYSQGWEVGPWVVTAGQVDLDPETGNLAATLEEQVELAIANLAGVLEAAGLNLTHVVKTNCFLTDINDFARFDAVYADHFRRPYPARSTYGVGLAGDLLFEIEAWAVRPDEDA